MKTVLALVAALCLGACAHASSSPPVQAPAATNENPAAVDKDPAAARELIARGAIVIDVRTAAEYATAHLARAVNIPVQELPGRIAEVETLVAGDMTRPIVVYCAAGGRAAKARAQLAAAGYSHVVNGGGLDDLRVADRR